MGDGASHLGYVPGLDGVRALAVVAVLLFHSGYGWASGGFLGVSVFFTLSGYLITTLLVAEHARSGRISLRSFYARRARRLLPASLLCLALVTAAWPWWNEGQRRALPGDVLAALADVANWRFALGGPSYLELFQQASSPVAHFWSLSIEEQCYLVLPVVVLLALRGGRRRLAAVLGALTVGSFAAMFATDDFDLAYNGTHTRAAELLIGALAAVLVAGRRPQTRRAHVAVQLTGAAALAALALAVVGAEVTDRWLLRGGFGAVATGTVVLLVGVSVPGPLAGMVGWRPLAAVGRVSYGVYLFHWPLFLLLTPERVGFGGAGLLALRCGAVAVCSLLSYRLLEQPIRTTRRLVTAPTALTALGASVVAIAVSVSVLPRPGATAVEQLLVTADTAGVVTFEPAPAVTPPVETPPVDSPVQPVGPQRLLVIGDSTSLLVARALSDAAPGRFEVRWAGEEGCPFVATVATRPAPDLGWVDKECPPQPVRLGEVLERFRPEAVLVVAGAMEMMEHRYPGDPGAYLPGSTAYQVRHDGAMQELLDVLVPFDAQVVVADAPPLGLGLFSAPAMTEPSRLDGWNAQIRRWAARHRDVSVLEYAGPLMAYEAANGNIRSDGSHPDLGPLTVIARDSLVPTLETLLTARP